MTATRCRTILLSSGGTIGTQRPRTQKRRQTPLSGHLQFQLLYVSELPRHPVERIYGSTYVRLERCLSEQPFRQSHQREKSADTWHELRIMDRRRITERMIDRRLFPRILALSEQMWHEGEALDFDRFYRNILHRKAWFEEAGFEFGPALKEDITKDYKWD